MRTPRRRSRRPTCPARPSSGRTSLADRRLPSPWTTRLPRAIDRSTMVKARTPRRATTTTATTTIRPSRRCRRGRATLPPMSGVVFPPAVGAGARGGRGGGEGGGWDGRSWGQQQSVRARAPDLRRSERGPRTAGEDERQVARGAVERARDEEGRRRRRPRIGRVVADSKHESGQQTGRILP